MLNRCIFFSWIIFIPVIGIFANDPEWDNAKKTAWPADFKEVEIVSTMDSKIQKAYFYKTKGNEKRPLVISLHTWSADYSQKDPLIKQIVEKNWNYIHPDFRGANNTIEACGSPLVLSDIDDAISYAIKQGNVDTHQIHIIGVSGGAYATLLAFMQSRHPIKTFSAWVPISDLTKWYVESKGRRAKYAKHIALATSGDSSMINIIEAIKRSPMYMNTPVSKRTTSKVYIYAGIHDGYKGSVPISHSIDIYNKIVRDFNPLETEALVSAEVKEQLLVARNNPSKGTNKIADRKIHYQQSFNNTIQITVFEGEHEMLTNVALSHIPSMNILTIGDSNGEAALGWPYQLQKLCFNHTIKNLSISGNTIGFDNMGKEKLNTVKMIDSYLKQTDPDKHRVDKIIIMLGTNDCKTEFDSLLKEVPKNYALLIAKIRSYYSPDKAPEIIMVSPPPYASDDFLQAKYKGASVRVAYLNNEFFKLSVNENVRYVNTYSKLLPMFDTFSYDGIHLTTLGSQIIANIIFQEIFSN